MNKGSVFIISGPSGSGKDTILLKLFEKRPDIAFSISSITREMRAGEKEGEKYNFISKSEFERMIEEDALLEYNEYVGNYYGTPKAPVISATDEGKDIIIEVDVNGAANIRKNLPEAVSIFILPPSFEVLKNRLVSRGTETAEVIEKRMKNAFREIERSFEYDYIVVNDDLDTAVKDVVSIIDSNRLKLENQKNIIYEVLEKC